MEWKESCQLYPQLGPDQSYLEFPKFEFGKFRNELDGWTILNLMFPRSRLEKELIWLVSSYVQYVWDTVHVRGADVSAEQFFGFLKFKYKELQTRSSNILENLQLFN